MALLWSSFFRTTSTIASSEAPADYQPAPGRTDGVPERQCQLSGGTEACSLGLRETPACIHVIQRLSQPPVACWHGCFRQNSQKTECVFTRCPTGGRKKNACIYGLRSEGVNQDHFHFSLTPLSDSRTNCSSFLSKILGILKSDASDISR